MAFSPSAANFIRPLEYAGSEETLNSVILYFSRLVLGVQLVLAGVQLPSRYLKTQWKPLSILLGPIMCAMWLVTSLLIWGLVPNIPFLHALAIGSCVTPTDPVLSNVIVKGKFADSNVPKELQRIIVAESGANDGLGYPFLFLALYLIKYIGDGGVAEQGGARTAMGLWFGDTWGYVIILSVVYGATVGWIAKELLHWAEEHKYVDRESFLVFALSLALFITGTCGLIGSDDVLACFIAGNTFTWDDWFRLETLDDSLQPTIDMLLNVTIFMWYGAVCPWDKFLHNDVIPIYRLIPLGILVLLLRRLPWVFAIHKHIPQIEEVRQAIFVGFFGPIGVSGIFYLYITLEFLETMESADGELRSDVAELPEAVLVVVWFLVICSVVSVSVSTSIEPTLFLSASNSKQVVHGLSIPLGKLGFYLPRTFSRRATESEGQGTPFNIGRRVSTLTLRLPRAYSRSRRNSQDQSGSATPSGAPSDRQVWRIGGTVIQGPSDPESAENPEQNAPYQRGPANRTIRFPDEAQDTTRTSDAVAAA